MLHLLLEDEYFSAVRVLARTTLSLSHPKLEVCVTDFTNPNDFHRSLGKGDIIFCCIGTTLKKVKGDKQLYRSIDYDIPLHAAQWGIDNGFTQFLVVSSVGANAGSSNFYLRLKGEMEAAIHALPYQALHIFHPSFLLGQRQEKRKGEKLVQLIAPAISQLLVGSLQKYRAIQSTDVAKAMLIAARSEKTGIHKYSFEQIQQLCQTKNL